MVFLMLLLSIGTIAFSTDSSFRRSLKKCELLEFTEYTNDDLYTTALSVFGDVECDDSPLYFGPAHEGEELIQKDYFQDWLYDKKSKEAFQVDDKDDNFTMPVTNSTLKNTTIETIKLPYKTVRVFALDVLEMLTIAFFSLDFLLRICSCPSKRRYFSSVTNLFDFIALFGSILNMIIISIERQYRYGIGWIKILRYLQVFRSFRFFRVFDHVRASKVLAYSLKKNCRDFALIILLFLFGVTLFSTILFFVEGRKVAVSIPHLWYWAVVTMTTVGYGDVVPETNIGRVVASLCSVSGVLGLAVALPVFVNNFIVLYQYSCIDNTWKSYLRKSSSANRKASKSFRKSSNAAGFTPKDSVVTYNTCA